MKYFDRGGEIEVTGVSDFDLVKIFECGQCFRWNADENGVYTGVAHGVAAHLRREGTSVFFSGTQNEFETVWRDYFDLERDYEEIRKRLCIDGFMKQATEFGAGIRILRQDSWEALCSFILSQCNNIRRIKRIINTLCCEFGDSIEFGDRVYHAFPSAGKLASQCEEGLSALRCGYRAAYVIGAARAVSEGALDLDSLSALSHEGVREALKMLRGVGNKVADCTALFGLGMLDAFPLDVWMKRSVAGQYGTGFDPVVFSPFAGIAQQYIFYYARKNHKA